MSTRTWTLEEIREAWERNCPIEFIDDLCAALLAAKPEAKTCEPWCHKERPAWFPRGCTPECSTAGRPLNPAPAASPPAWLPLGQHPGGACKGWCGKLGRTGHCDVGCTDRAHYCEDYCHDRAKAVPRETLDKLAAEGKAASKEFGERTKGMTGPSAYVDSQPTEQRPNERTEDDDSGKVPMHQREEERVQPGGGGVHGGERVGERTVVRGDAERKDRDVHHEPGSPRSVRSEEALSADVRGRHRVDSAAPARKEPKPLPPGQCTSGIEPSDAGGRGGGQPGVPAGHRLAPGWENWPACPGHGCNGGCATRGESTYRRVVGSARYLYCESCAIASGALVPVEPSRPGTGQADVCSTCGELGDSEDFRASICSNGIHYRPPAPGKPACDDEPWTHVCDLRDEAACNGECNAGKPDEAPLSIPDSWRMASGWMDDAGRERWCNFASHAATSAFARVSDGFLVCHGHAVEAGAIVHSGLGCCPDCQSGKPGDCLCADLPIPVGPVPVSKEVGCLEVYLPSGERDRVRAAARAVVALETQLTTRTAEVESLRAAATAQVARIAELEASKRQCDDFAHDKAAAVLAERARVNEWWRWWLEDSPRPHKQGGERNEGITSGAPAPKATP